MFNCEMTDNSLPKIGKEFGGRDHSTVLHAYNKIKNMLAQDDSLRIENWKPSKTRSDKSWISSKKKLRFIHKTYPDLVFDGFQFRFAD